MKFLVVVTPPSIYQYAGRYFTHFVNEALQRTRDGRGAFQAIQRHTKGKSKWNKVLEDAESMVQTRVWNGKNSRFLLKAHTNKHREAHNDFSELHNTLITSLQTNTQGCQDC